jgi:hypothetical protein
MSLERTGLRIAAANRPAATPLRSLERRLARAQLARENIRLRADDD